MFSKNVIVNDNTAIDVNVGKGEDSHVLVIDVGAWTNCNLLSTTSIVNGNSKKFLSALALRFAELAATAQGE
jgi:hypothetical protein